MAILEKQSLQCDPREKERRRSHRNSVWAPGMDSKARAETMTKLRRSQKDTRSHLPEAVTSRAREGGSRGTKPKLLPNQARIWEGHSHLHSRKFPEEKTGCIWKQQLLQPQHRDKKVTSGSGASSPYMHSLETNNGKTRQSFKDN